MTGHSTCLEWRTAAARLVPRLSISGATMRPGILTTCTLATLVSFTSAGCGGGTPAPDSTIGASPAGADSTATAVTTVAADSSRPASSAGAVNPTPPATTTRPPAPATGERAGGRASQAERAAADTVRGIVSEVGSYPTTSVVVRPASGSPVTITGALAREIGRAAGAEVWVSGERDARSITARSYAVRTVDGQPATDGVIARDGDGLVLVTPTGHRPIARPLQALRGMIGARVWLVGPLDGTITSYGILREP